MPKNNPINRYFFVESFFDRTYAPKKMKSSGSISLFVMMASRCMNGFIARKAWPINAEEMLPKTFLIIKKVMKMINPEAISAIDFDAMRTSPT